MTKRRRNQYECLESRQLMTIDVSVISGLTFESPSVYSPANLTNDGFTSSAYVDLDGDGNKDLVYGLASVKGITVAKSLGNGQFESSPTRYDLPRSVSNIEVSDINNDGALDVVAADDSIVFMMLGQSENNAWSGFSLSTSFRAKTS